MARINERYVLGNEIGKGAFGVVYECQDTATGGTVAVKRISMVSTLSKERLSGIESEVLLLQKLDHPNIVKYICTVRTTHHLHIVLEYMENGCLASNVRKFGTFSQSLVSLYIRQVLQGLEYLHEQGVIHRDIKGANILTTKSGLVKLADFGVSTQANMAKASSVVGTPYWMAPEVIEMSGPSTKCDIWSVGCTIVELLTSKPPYFDIPAMSAMFRIVQDDHPPLPDGLSPALQDFLLLCFKKEPLLRSKASDLLQHRWVNKARNQSDISAFDKSEAKAKEVSEKERQSWRKSVMNTIKISEAERSKTLEKRRKPHGTGQKNQAAKVKVEQQLRAMMGSSSTVESRAKEAAAFDFDFSDEDEGSPSMSSSAEEKKGSTVEESESEEDKKQVFPASLSQKSLSQEGIDLQELDAAFAGDISFHRRLSRASGLPANLTGKRQEKTDKLSAFREDESDIMEELGDNLSSDGVVSGNVNVELELRNRMAAALERTGSENDADIEEFSVSDEEKDFQEGGKRSLAAVQSARVQQLIEQLIPDQDAETLIAACEGLVSVFVEWPEQRRTLLTHHGIIPIMEMLELSHDAKVLHGVLRVVLAIIENDRAFQELLSLAGLIPIVAKYAAPRNPREIRLQAASLVKQFLHTSTVTLHLFVACGGISVLTQLLLTEPSNADPDIALASVGLQGFHNVLQLSCESMPKNDFCRLFCRNGALVPLQGLLQYCMTGSGEANCAKVGLQASHMVQRVAEILEQFSLGDAVVKQALASGQVLRGVLTAITLLAARRNAQQSLKVLLKCIKNLCMEPSVLRAIEEAEAVSTLVPILGAQRQGGEEQEKKELESVVMLALFYLCRLSVSRQEQAAVAGVVPLLKAAIVGRSAVKTFALQILCDMAHASALCRRSLWKEKVFDLYLNLLVSGDVFWEEKALAALEVWMRKGESCVELAMSQPKALDHLFSIFHSAHASHFEHCVKVILQMLQGSPMLAESISRSGLFVEELVTRLSYPKAEVRISLLKIIKAIASAAPLEFKRILLDHDILNAVAAVATEAREAHRVLVLEVATRLIQEWTK